MSEHVEGVRPPLAFHPNAFVLAIGGERCHVCGRLAEWTVGGQWRCAFCRLAWISGSGRVRDRVRSGRERMVV